MQVNTPFFPNFQLPFGRRRKSAIEKLEEARKSITDLLPGPLPSIFGEALPLESIPKRNDERNRGFSSAVTVWHMINQGMVSGTLRAGLVEINATLKSLGLEKLSSCTGGICQARQRLPDSTMHAVHGQVLNAIDRSIHREDGRTLYVDGTGFQLCDTPDNQADYPQPTNQKPGCGFPVMQQVALIDAHSGAVIDSIDSTWKEHEGCMFQVGPLACIGVGDTLMGDTAYCSFWNFALIQQAGAQAITPLHQARRYEFPRGADEYRTTWSKPTLNQTPQHITDAEWKQLPAKIEVRHIRYRFQRKGFRPVVKVIATTDLKRPAKEILEVYGSRWDIELCFRDIKSTMGLDFIRAKSPEMARKVYGFGLIAYNLIRWQMLRSSGRRSTRRLSFTGAREAILKCCAQIKAVTRSTRTRLEEAIKELVYGEKLVNRPGRREPRVRKRRPKKFQLMTKPRDQMEVSPSRRQK